MIVCYTYDYNYESDVYICICGFEKQNETVLCNTVHVILHSSINANVFWSRLVLPCSWPFGHVVQQPRMLSILEASAGHVAHVRLAGCQPAGGVYRQC